MSSSNPVVSYEGLKIHTGKPVVSILGIGNL